MYKRASITSTISQDLLKRVGMGAAIGAAGGAVATGKDGSISENILKGAIGGGLAGGAYHGVKDHFSDFKGVANKLRGIDPSASSLFSKDKHLLGRLNASFERIFSGDKATGLGDMKRGLAEAHGRIAGKMDDRSHTMRGMLNDLGDLTHQAERSELGRSAQKFFSFGFGPKNLKGRDSVLQEAISDKIKALHEFHQ